MRDSDMLELARAEAQELIASKDSGEIRAAVRYIQENWQRRYGFVQVG